MCRRSIFLVNIPLLQETIIFLCFFLTLLSNNRLSVGGAYFSEPISKNHTNSPSKTFHLADNFNDFPLSIHENLVEFPKFPNYFCIISSHKAGGIFRSSFIEWFVAIKSLFTSHFGASFRKELFYGSFRWENFRTSLSNFITTKSSSSRNKNVLLTVLTLFHLPCFSRQISCLRSCCRGVTFDLRHGKLSDRQLLANCSSSCLQSMI